MSDLYQEIILEEIKNPQHQGELIGADVLQRHELNASCGDEVTIYLKIAKKLSSTPNTTPSPTPTSSITLKWQGQGCAISMAAMSLLAEKINSQQLSKKQIQALTLEDLLNLLGLDEIAPGRLKCMMLGLKAVQAALS